MVYIYFFICFSFPFQSCSTTKLDFQIQIFFFCVKVKPKCWGIYSWLPYCCGACNMKSLESFVKEFILMVTFLNLTMDMYGRNIKSHYPYDITTFHYINIHCYHSPIGCNCVAVAFHSYL